jgi:hypothetical protein
MSEIALAASRFYASPAAYPTAALDTLSSFCPTMPSPSSPVRDAVILGGHAGTNTS